MQCSKCGKTHFILGQKWICPTCDVLLVDIEIECDENSAYTIHKYYPSEKNTQKEKLHQVKK